MFGFAASLLVYLLLISVIVVVIIALLTGLASRVVQVVDEAQLPGDADDTQRRLLDQLSDIRGAVLEAPTSGQYTLTRKRSVPWAIVPAILLFPLGLLFFLVRDDLVLTFQLEPRSAGTHVRVVGRTEKRIWQQLALSFAAA